MDGNSNVFFSSDFFEKVKQQTDFFKKVKQQTENKVILNMIACGIENDPKAEQGYKLLCAFSRRGIPLKIVLECFTELADEGTFNAE